MINEEFHRTNINLRQDDVEWLRQHYGHGWTEKVREIVHRYVGECQKLTTEDLENAFYNPK